MICVKNLAILMLLFAEGNSNGLSYLNVFYPLSHFDESISSQTPFSFTKPVPARIPVKGMVDLSFYVNHSVVFQYRYRLEVPYGAEEAINNSLIRWTDWINKDVNEVLVPKLGIEGRYKMVIEYKTHISNEIRKYEKPFEVYNIEPVYHTNATQSTKTSNPENAAAKEKVNITENKPGEIHSADYQSRNKEQEVTEIQRTIATEIPVSVKPADKAIVAQDIIIKHNGEEIRSKVLEITPDLIRYIDYGRSDNPSREIRISEVFMIKYRNGTSEMFSRPTEDKEYQPARVAERTIPKSTDQNSATTRYSESLDKKGRMQLRKQGNYLSIAAGWGNSYGGLGLSMQYLSPGNLKFGIHGGAGYLPLGAAPAFLYSGGLKIYFWDFLYADLQFGSFGTYYKIYQQSPYEPPVSVEGILYGPGLLAGYDWFFSDHCGINIAAGASYDIGEYLKDFQFAFDLGFVYRF